MRKSIALITLAGATLAGSIAFTSAAQAEPQALALVATGGAIELGCQGAECGAEFTTFCLETDRFSPVRGTPYRPAEDGEIRLVGTTAEGREISLDGRGHLRFESVRAHLAMRITISRREMDRLGLERVAVVVGENVSLLPLTAAGDTDRHDQQELDLVAGPLRRLGGKIVDSNQERMVAARITNRMINALPAGSADRGPGESLWRRALEGFEADALPAAAVTMARTAYDLCSYAVASGSMGPMRPCLEGKHDSFVNYLNSDYWKASKTGS